MALPSSWKMVEVHGTYLRVDGLINAGSLWFESDQTVTILSDDHTAEILVVPSRIEAQLDAQGHFSVMLPSTNDPDISPVGWTYQVSEKIAGGRTYSIEVPFALDSIDIVAFAHATPVPPISPVVTYLTTADIGINVASQTAVNTAKSTADQAEADAQTAISTSNMASASASAAVGTANNAQLIAGQASNAATAASAASAAATSVANTAAATAAQASTDATAATQTAATASTNATTALATANGIDAKATQALSQSAAAVTTAGNAQTTAASASATADQASTDAGTAVLKAGLALSQANNASTVSATAITTANNAATAAQTAGTKADNATTAAATATTSANAATTTANTASTNASAAVTTANGAKTSADAATVASTAATTTANGAKTSADAATAASVAATTTANGAKTSADAATAAAASATTTANGAKTSADTATAAAASATTTANTASTNATAAQTAAANAQTTATSAVSTASSAQSQANAAVLTANGAVTTANTASTNATAAQTTAGNAVTTANAANALALTRAPLESPTFTASGTPTFQVASDASRITNALLVNQSLTTALLGAALDVKAGPTTRMVVLEGGGRGIIGMFNSDGSAAGPMQISGDSINFTVSSGQAIGLGGTTNAAKFNINTSNDNSSLTVTDTGTSGSNIKLVGDGTATPNKTVRVKGGIYQILNSAYDTVLFALADNGNITMPGAITAAGGFQNSDERLKSNIVDADPRQTLADELRLKDYVLRSTGLPARGLIAQDVQHWAPEYVIADDAGILAIDKAGIALECVLGLAKRVQDLEAQIETLVSKLAEK